jgi:hypothetical protein
MSDPDFEKSKVEMLAKHTEKLDEHYKRVEAASKMRTHVENIGDILKAISDAAEEAENTLDYYGETDQIPAPTRNLMKHTLDEISNLAAGLYANFRFARK